MLRSVSLCLALLGGALAAAACYTEKPAPPGYRYLCNSDGDCRPNETCINELCQVPCTQATAKDDCTGSDHLLCFNGVCTSGCNVDNENCPHSQECLDLEDLGIMLEQGGSSFFSTPSGPTGLCANFCDPEDPKACPTGELCLAGFCVATCEDSSTCTTELVCQDGFCLPPIPDTTGVDTFAGSSDSGSGGSDSGSATTGGVL
jgi:hypothetical protein